MHYLFSMHDIFRVLRGILLHSQAVVDRPSDLLRLWAHETRRVYEDRLSSQVDIVKFRKALNEVANNDIEQHAYVGSGDALDLTIDMGPNVMFTGLCPGLASIEDQGRGGGGGGGGGGGEGGGGGGGGRGSCAMIFSTWAGRS